MLYLSCLDCRGGPTGARTTNPPAMLAKETPAESNIWNVGPSGWDYCSAPVVLGGAWSPAGVSVQPTIVLMQKTTRQQASRTRRSIVGILSNRNK